MTESTLRVLAITPWLPYPGIDHAGGAFLFDYLTALARRCEVMLVAPDELANRAHVDLAPVRTKLVETHRRYPPPIRDLETLWSGPTPGGHVLRGIRHDVAVLEALRTCDIVELHWGYLLSLVPWLRHRAPNKAIVVHGHDVISQNLVRRAAHAGLIERVLTTGQARRVARLERKHLNRVDAAYYFSDKDLQLLRNMGVRVPMRVLDPPLYQPQQQDDRRNRSTTVLFVGALQRPENHDGIAWYLDNVWPNVIARVPNARLVIAGANPPPKLLEKRSNSVLVTGYVPDLEPSFRGASVFVAPLLSGAGLKFKIAQAMLYGLPIVTTPIGAEGFDDGPSPAPIYAITLDASTMSDAVVELLQNPVARFKSGENGRRWAERRFSFARSIDEVLLDYSQLHANSLEASG